jgi:DNA-binding NarL/FixJ family response regulator
MAGVPRTVVIVDDHPSFRAVARALLESEGYEVIGEAADGAGGLEAARTLCPDWILLDVSLPDIDGFEVTARLVNGPGAPAVVLTSSREAADFGRRIAACGARGFVAKADLSGATLSALLGPCASS